MLSKPVAPFTPVSEAQRKFMRKIFEEALSQPPSEHGALAIAVARRTREFEEAVNNDPNALVKMRDYRLRGIFNG